MQSIAPSGWIRAGIRAGIEPTQRLQEVGDRRNALGWGAFFNGYNHTENPGGLANTWTRTHEEVNPWFRGFLRSNNCAIRISLSIAGVEVQTHGLDVHLPRLALDRLGSPDSQVPNKKKRAGELGKVGRISLAALQTVDLLVDILVGILDIKAKHQNVRVVGVRMHGYAIWQKGLGVREGRRGIERDSARHKGGERERDRGSDEGRKRRE